MAIFALLEVFQKNCPIIVQVGFQSKGILKVHLLNILFTLISLKSLYYKRINEQKHFETETLIIFRVIQKR